MKSTHHKNWRRWSRLIVIGLLSVLIVLPLELADAQRGGRSGGGSFGGGRSYGGSFGRSSGGSFGGSRSSSGGGFGGSRSSSTFGGSRSSSSFGGGGGTFGRSSGGSFGRSGSFGSSGGITRSTSAPRYYGQTPSFTRSYMYNGAAVPGYGFGFWSGFSLGWAVSSPPWYYHTPFHPAFYFHRPVYYNGGLYPGGFSWGNFFLSLFIFLFVIWLLIRLFSGGMGGRKRVRYTSY